MPTSRCYTRASTSMQPDSPIVQQEIIRNYCTAHGLPAPLFYQDMATSGTKSIHKREAGGMLLRDLKPGDFMVVSKLDRMTRNMRDCAAIVEYCQRHKVTLHICNFGGAPINLGTPMGRAMLHMMAAFAVLERDMIAERTGDSLRSLRKRGRAIGRPGYGYKHVKAPGNQKTNRGAPVMLVVPDPEERAVMQRLVEYRRLRWSWHQIYEQITYVEKLKTRDGKEWNMNRIIRATRRELLLQLSELRRCDEPSH